MLGNLRNLFIDYRIEFVRFVTTNEVSNPRCWSHNLSDRPHFNEIKVVGEALFRYFIAFNMI